MMSRMRYIGNTPELFEKVPDPFYAFTPPMNTAFSKILIIGISITFITGGGVLAWRYFAPKEEAKAPGDETTHWKIYRNEDYGFEFKYSDNWIRAGAICDRNPFCLYLTVRDKLPKEKDVEVCFEIDLDECTAEGFDAYRNALSSGILPKGVSQEPWGIIKLGGKNAMQSIYYNVYMGHYVIETRIFTDDVRILFMAILPIQPFYKDENVFEYLVVDTEKSQEREKDLQQGSYPNEETKTILSNYNRMLSTFKFLE